MLETIKWEWFEVKRLYRLLRPENSVKTFIKIVGPWWLWWHGCRREFKIKLWKGRGKGWYCPDFCFPKIKVIIEADGLVHGRAVVKKYDIARDWQLQHFGWIVERKTIQEMLQNPSKVRRDVRRFIKAHEL